VTPEKALAEPVAPARELAERLARHGRQSSTERFIQEFREVVKGFADKLAASGPR